MKFDRTIVITGGAGFIGSHKILSNKGWLK